MQALKKGVKSYVLQFRQDDVTVCEVMGKVKNEEMLCAVLRNAVVKSSLYKCDPEEESAVQYSTM